MGINHPTDALPPGYRLGPYEILRVLGRGGFGITYQARRAGLAGDMVAVKELFPHGVALRLNDQSIVAAPGTEEQDVAGAVQMFLREAKLICGLDHPNIVQGVDAFQANGTGYLVMRYVSGKNLRDSLRDPTGFKPDARSLPAMFVPLLDALATLHQHELLHCDIKPDNIFLGVGFEPILIDLGAARLHIPGVGCEDPSTYSHYFSAIEQGTDRYGPIGPWTDIYQLSAVLYRCITGGKLPDAIDRARAAEDPYLPVTEIREATAAYPAELLRAVDAGLGLHPRSRPQSVAQWRRMFQKVLPKQASRKPGPPRLPAANKPAAAQPAAAEQPKSDNVILGPTETLVRPGPTAGSKGPDCLVWLAGGLLVLIFLIVAALVLDG